MKLYQHPRCSTCKKAIAFLEKNKLKYQDVDITAKPPSKTELKSMLKHKDGEIRKLFNTSGQMYRQLNLSKKLDSMSDKEALDLLAKEGMLVKRPFILTKDVGLVGFKEAEWKAALK